MLTQRTLSAAGIDAVALKPTECDVRDALSLGVDTVVVDYEGREHLPGAATLRALAAESTVYLTTPVRADGFDPLGDDSLADLPEGVGRVLVAGNAAYLADAERKRAIAPRLRAALDGIAEGAGVDPSPAPWVGTEGVERLALAATSEPGDGSGGASSDGRAGASPVQYDLLGRTTERELRALRTVGFEGDVAVYAPTVLTDDDDAILDAVGAYVARRRAVARALPEGGHADRRATGRAREVLLAAARDFALVGTAEEVREQVAALRAAGATTVVCYPARGLRAFT
ncbi:luciferase [Halomarina halobia]|uniref:Luciferase n=1 Tax=Halomarina halobia TaxID=3033386 RepID=A0ABD6AD25_9EURY|nr:luciferase [Halomarina sp. PSR21]